MGSPITKGDFQGLLDLRLTKVWDEEAKKPELKGMIDQLFTVKSSDSAFEESFYTTGVGDIPEFNGKITYLPVYPGWHKRAEHKTFSAGIQVEREIMDDKKYPVLDDNAKKLLRSSSRTREKWASRIFTNAPSTAFDFQTNEEGVGLASSAHLTRATDVSTSTGFDNTSTSALSKTSAAALRIKMKKFRTDIGERFEMSDNFGLLVPDSLVDTALEISGSQLDPDSANNKINPSYQRYKVIPYSRMEDSDINNWAMVNLDLMKDNLTLFDRIKAELKNTIDFDTYMILQAVYFRMSVMVDDWRWGAFATVS
ncbi:MAG: hypothetical protein WC736_15405 [Gallionella sp.]|jgi:hypothetical protein